MQDDVLQEFLEESWDLLSQLETEVVSLEKDPCDSHLLGCISRRIHTINRACGFIGLTGLGRVAQSAEKALEKMRDGAVAVSPGPVSLVLESIEEIKALLEGLEATGEEPQRDNADLIARLEKLEGGTSEESHNAQALPSTVSAGQQNAIKQTVNSTPVQIAKPSSSLEKSSADVPSPGTGTADPSVQVNHRDFDSLMNLTGELVLTRNRLVELSREDGETKFSAPINRLNRVTTDLQEQVLKNRMQPIGNVWNAFPRLVRELAETSNRRVELKISGTETELDPTVLDAVKDPLTQLLRNSVVHGIESAKDRRRKGKPETGKIKLDAFHDGEYVIISVEDDGCGLRTNRVLEETGSTAEDGNGLNGVRTAIERIGGMVELTSLEEQGTTIRIQVPQSQAIIPALVVESCGESFAIPQLNVIELVRLTADLDDKIQQIHDREFFRLRDRLLPLVSLSRVLEFEEAYKAGVREMIIVVVQAGDGQFGLIVSDVFDTDEIVVKPLGSLLMDISIYQGATVLGDERVILILDVAGIAEQFGGLSSDSAKSESIENEETGDAGETISLLLFNSGTGSTMSVPLSLVSRLEEFPRESIEQCGDRLVVQYHGDLLPLLPISGLTQVEDLPETQTVIVFSEGRSSMGLMVQKIQDILEEQLIIRMHSDRPGVLGTAIINGKATDVIDTQHFIMTASPEWFIRNEEKHNYRVLVIDDSLFFRQLVTTSLESEDFNVTSASSAIQAVELIEHGAQFDFIISDIEMPMMDGYEFAQWFKKRPDEKSPPLIALSSLRGAAVESRALESGFDRYLTKFNARQLVRSIEELSLEMADSGVKS